MAYQKGSSSSTDTTVAVPLRSDDKMVKLEMVERSDGCPGGYQLVDPERIAKTTDPMDLVELAKQVQKADEFVRARAVGKLELIAEQMRHLQEQARRVLEDSRRDDLLHHTPCNMKKVPGQIYAMYERASGQKYFSMLLPEEWGDSCPHKFLGTYRLEYDMSWTPAERMEARKKEINLMDRILDANKQFNPSLESSGGKQSTSIDLLQVEGPMKMDQK